MKSYVIFSCLAILLTVPDVEAGWRRNRQNSYPVAYATQSYTISPSSVSQPSQGQPLSNEAIDALHEVNTARAQRGLSPFIHDPNLTAAAMSCAQTRAAYLAAGHTANDFAALPPGVSARAAGCGALDLSWGWGTCCTYENYQYAGAAYVWGRDNKRYMHLFVR